MYSVKDLCLNATKYIHTQLVHIYIYVPGYITLAVPPTQMEQLHLLDLGTSGEMERLAKPVASGQKDRWTEHATQRYSSVARVGRDGEGEPGCLRKLYALALLRLLAAYFACCDVDLLDPC